MISQSCDPRLSKRNRPDFPRRLSPHRRRINIHYSDLHLSAGTRALDGATHHDSADGG